jgi:hypothetical protein
MPLGSLIADTSKAVDDDPGNAQALFTAEGTLVGVTEVDIQTGAHSFKADEPPALGGADMAANRCSTRWPRSGRARPSPTSSGLSSSASGSTV